MRIGQRKDHKEEQPQVVPLLGAKGALEPWFPYP